jgi:hypothetical protein
LRLINPSTLPNELNTTLTPHSIIHGDACFAYFNKIWGIPASFISPPFGWFSFGTRGRFVPYHSSKAVGLSFMRFPLALILVMLASTAHAQSREQKPVDWRTFEIPDFGTRIQYPAGIFSPAGKPEKGVGQRFERADGRAVLSIYSRPNEAGDNPATYLRSNLRVSRSAMDYTRITRSFFAISSERAGVILYSRCNFSGGARGAIHCFDLKYPQEEKRAWDAVVTRISLSLRPLES